MRPTNNNGPAALQRGEATTHQEHTLMSRTKRTPGHRDQLRGDMRRALDARALNLEQQRLIFNPSPEIDSLAEIVGRALSGRPAQELADARRLLKRLLQSNHAEGEYERELAASIEQALSAHFNAGRTREAVPA